MAVCMRWFSLVAIVLMSAFVRADDAADKKESPKPPETVKATSDVLREYESVDTRIEATRTAELAMNMEVFSTLVVDTILPPGTRVKKGAIVATFKKEKLEDLIRDAKYGVQMATIALEEAETNLSRAILMNDLDQQLAKQAWARAQEDADYYKRVAASLAARQAEKNLESSQFQAEYAKDELDQLEKMYKEDELTEESEEIVLKRARRSLDQARFYLEMAKARTAHVLETELPREKTNQEQSLARAKLEHEKAMTSLPAQRQLKELEVQKQKFALEKQQRELEKLEADLTRLTLRAPADGIVYHGQARRGAWRNAPGRQARVIEVGESIPDEAVVITIASLDDLRLRGEVAEKQLAAIRPGLTGVARPTCDPERTFQAKVTEIGNVPVEDGKFDCILSGDRIPDGLVPGMTCAVKFLVYENKKAVLAPKASVFSDDDGQSHYVFVPTADGHERRDVKVGKTKGDMLEIRSGLAKGDTILKSKPD